MAWLKGLPQGAARRTVALRMKLKAARLAHRTAEALETARLLSKHRAFSAGAAQSIVRGLSRVIGQTSGTKCFTAKYRPATPCPPAAMAATVLPTGKVLFWDGLEGMNDVDHSVVAEFGDVAMDDQSRTADFSDNGANPDFTPPTNRLRSTKTSLNESAAVLLRRMPCLSSGSSWWNPGSPFSTTNQLGPPGVLARTASTYAVTEFGAAAVSALRAPP